MKHLVISVSCIFIFILNGQSQPGILPVDTIKVVLENEKLKVTEYSSTPGKDVCGKGNHSHPPHLTILLSDAMVRVTIAGNTQDFNVKSGAAFWSDAETHIAVNTGRQPVKAYIVELK